MLGIISQVRIAPGYHVLGAVSPSNPFSRDFRSRNSPRTSREKLPPRKIFLARLYSHETNGPSKFILGADFSWE